MQTIKLAGYECRVFPGTEDTRRNHIYFMDVAAHPFDGDVVMRDIRSTVISIEVVNWDDDLTPWPAKGLYPSDEDFKGCADSTLQKITEGIIPSIETLLGSPAAHRALSGYSLGGLFATYGFLNSDAFEAVASMSGSFWYPDWMDYLGTLESDHRNIVGRFAYFSLGNKEHEARPAILHAVQTNTQKTVSDLQRWGSQTEFQLNEGNHFHHVNERIARGFQALGHFFTK